MTDDKIFACICEGTTERVIINKLLDNDKLIFNRENLLDNEILKCRSAHDFEDKYLGKSFKSKITVYRILDSHTEKFKLRKAYENKVVDVINVITAPEIEMLVIINEDMYKEYDKHKSILKPSDFCKKNLKMSKVKNKQFIEKYFSDLNVLLDCIIKYKRLANIHKQEKCLADILK